MNFVESPVVFDVENEGCIGITAIPDTPQNLGVLIIVGGPQYRVGSHRQFVLLSRFLAHAGFPSFRFDYRGMGDSDGDLRDFEGVAEDIAAAIRVFRTQCPAVTRIVLWGLCDAASAALLYINRYGDAPVTGLVLLNPWVRSEASLAQTHVKHYYGQRLLQADFWLKMLSGKLQLTRSVKEFVRAAILARSRGESTKGGVSASFQQQMARGWRSFNGKILLVLSGDDYTAKEFQEYAAHDLAWQGALALPHVQRVDLADADHTFSSHAWRQMVEVATLDWIRSI